MNYPAIGCTSAQYIHACIYTRMHMWMCVRACGYVHVCE